MSNMNQNVGYCPQFDALDDLLTGREMLTCYAKLKAIPGDDIKDVVDRAIQLFQMGNFVDKVVKGYSGGMKRRLSTAVALLGDPAVVLLVSHQNIYPSNAEANFLPRHKDAKILEKHLNPVVLVLI